MARSTQVALRLKPKCRENSFEEFSVTVKQTSNGESQRLRLR